MTDAANSEYGVGNFNNRMRLFPNEDNGSDIIYNDQDMEAELANKAFEKIAKRDSQGKRQFTVRNSSAFSKRMSQLSSYSRTNSIVDALF